jgi:hypothetical protein
MPNLPISQLPELTAMTQNAEFVVAQSGTTYKIKRGYLASGKLFLSAYETAVQSGFTINTPYSVSASTIAGSAGITVLDNSKFQVQSGGTFNLEFSLQLTKLQGGTEEEIDIWLAKNGVDVEWSNTRITFANNGVLAVAAWNFVETMNANDYLELKFSVSDTEIVIFSLPPQTSPTRPGIPSAIVTLTQI